MFSRKRTKAVVLASMVATGNGCSRHECYIHPELCQPQITNIQASELMYSKGGNIEFDVNNLSDFPELNDDFSKVVVQLTQTSSKNPDKLVIQGNHFIATFNPTTIQSFEKSSASLQVQIYSSKTADQPIDIVGRSVSFDTTNAMPYTDMSSIDLAPTPVKAMISNQILYCLQKGMNQGDYFLVKEYQYSSMTGSLTPQVLGRQSGSVGAVSADLISSGTTTSVLRVRPNLPMPTNYEVSTCASSDGACGPVIGTIPYTAPSFSLGAKQSANDFFVVAYPAYPDSASMSTLFSYSISYPMTGTVLINKTMPMTGLTDGNPSVKQIVVNTLGGSTEDQVVVVGKSTINVYTRQGDNSLKISDTLSMSLQKILPSPSSLSGIALGDIDGDGVTDIAATHDNKIDFYFGRKDNTYRVGSQHIQTPWATGGIAIGDLDNDKLNDLAVISTANNIVVYRQLM